MFDPARGINKVDCVVVMFFDTSGNRKNIGVEDDVLWREVNFIYQDAISTFTNFFLARKGIGLAFFIKRHHHRSSAITFDQGGLSFELIHAFFHADRVDDAFALNTTQTRFNHRPFAGIDHHWHARNVWFARHEV